MGRNTGDGGFRVGDVGTLLVDKRRRTTETGQSRMTAGWFYIGREHDGRRTETLE